MEIAEIKTALRREVLARRRRAHDIGAGARLDVAASAAAGFLEAGLAEGTGVVSGYRPIRSEIDPTLLMETLIESGHRLAVPVIEGPGQPLRFREWTPATAMVAGPFGAEVPASGDWLTPQVLIVPLVAFDRRGGRLGYGGGFYDRTLAGLRARGRVLAVGFAYGAQEVAEVPSEATDQRLDRVVTESEVIQP